VAAPFEQAIWINFFITYISNTYKIFGHGTPFAKLVSVNFGWGLGNPGELSRFGRGLLPSPSSGRQWRSGGWYTL
jgi:hypothetical protein